MEILTLCNHGCTSKRFSHWSFTVSNYTSVLFRIMCVIYYLKSICRYKSPLSQFFVTIKSFSSFSGGNACLNLWDLFLLTSLMVTAFQQSSDYSTKHHHIWRVLASIFAEWKADKSRQTPTSKAAAENWPKSEKYWTFSSYTVRSNGPVLLVAVDAGPTVNCYLASRDVT